MALEKRGSLYFDKKNQRYKIDWHETLSIVVGELLLDEILAARQYMRGRLLDVGCGKRPYSLIYDSHVKSSWGTETIFSPHGTSEANLICMAEALPFRNQCFDTIVCTEVLEHTQQPFLVMREFTRLLKPGGHLILSIPFLYPLHEAPYDYWRFTAYGLEKISKLSGLHPIYIHSKGGVIAVIVSLLVNLLVRGLNLVSKTLKLKKPLRDQNIIRLLLVVPQWIYLWFHWKLFKVFFLERISGWMTPGFVLLASKPVDLV